MQFTSTQQRAFSWIAIALVVLALLWLMGPVVTPFVVASVLAYALTPRLVGERIGLHPLAVIFALLAFGQIFGLVGVLVALPASAVLLVAMRRVQANYLKSRLFTG